MMEYKIGGKIFLKKGGKYMPKPTFQGGGMTVEEAKNQYGSILGNANSALRFPNNNDSQSSSQTGKDTPSVWSTLANLGAVGLNSVARKPQAGLSPRGGAIQKMYGDTGVEKILGAGLSTVAALDLTGTGKAIESAINIGRAAKNVINPGDEYGVSKNNNAEVIGNIIDPIGRFQQSINIGKRKGFGEGLKDLATFGVSGNNLMRKDVNNGIQRDKLDDMRMREGENQGAYRNDSIYAKMGASIKPKFASNQEPNVEIETGEIVLGNPKSIFLHGQGSTSLESKYAAMFHGDTHEQDSDGDGNKGIPLTSGEAYVASDYLGLNGKKSGSGNKSVAQEMKPYIKYLHGGEVNSMDPYKNNPIAIAETNRQIGLLKSEAEKNKFMQGISSVAKKKGSGLTEMLSYMVENAPMEDLNPEEQSQLTQATSQLNNQINNQNQQPMNYQRMMARFGGHYMQQGGMTQPEENLSGTRMDQLISQSPGIDQQQAPAPAEGGQLSPEAQQALQQLPPEVQEQIMQLPPEQQEQAIMQYAQQMQAQQQSGAPAEGQEMPQGMPAQGGEEMVQPEMGMEQGQPVMRCGGKMYRRGDYIRFQRGGTIQEGRISNINPHTGGFSLG